MLANFVWWLTVLVLNVTQMDYSLFTHSTALVVLKRFVISILSCLLGLHCQFLQ